MSAENCTTLFKSTVKESSQVLCNLIGDINQIPIHGISFMNRNRMAAIIDHEIRSRMGIWKIEILASASSRNKIFTMRRMTEPHIIVEDTGFGNKFHYNIGHSERWLPLAGWSCNLFGTGTLLSLIFPNSFWRNVLQRLVNDLHLDIPENGKDFTI